MPEPEKPRHVLLIRLDGMGDTVLTTPLIRALREAWPQVKITLVASPAGAGAVLGHPGLDHVEVIDMRRSSLGEKWRLAWRLRSLHCDVAITVTEKAWGYLWAWLSGARRRVGFWAGATQPLKTALFWPTVNLKVSNPNDPSKASGSHEAERILRLLQPLGLIVGAPQSWMPGEAAPLPDGKYEPPTLGLHLSLKWTTDGYSDAWLTELLQALAPLAPGGLRVSAGPAEQHWASGFLASLPPGLVKTMNTKTFASWCDDLRACSVLVTPDTGAVHVGAALGVPVVDVFARAGHEHCVERWKPLGVPHRVVLRGRGDKPGEAETVSQAIVQGCRELLAEVSHEP